MKFMKIVVTLVVMIFLIQQVQKINADPSYLPGLLDMITSDTSAEVK